MRILTFMLLGTLPALAAAVTIQAPAQVVAQQPFSVTISVAGAQDGQVATLSVVTDSPGLTLGGTLETHVSGGTATFPGVTVTGRGSIRLTAVVVNGNDTLSGVSTPIQVGPPAYRDTSQGGIGVDLVVQNGQLTVSSTLGGMPAAQAGVQAGDQILQVDGKPLQGLDDSALGALLGGPVGSPLVLTVRHKGGSETQNISLVRVAMKHAAMQFETVPNQSNDGLFQISVAVFDGTGQPLPGATVVVTLNPQYNKVHVLFVTAGVVLKDGSGTVVDQVTGTTGPDGKAAMWVRLASNATPYKAVLTAAASWQQQPLFSADSNVFTVYDPSN